jgi:hypothetical protein
MRFAQGDEVSYRPGDNPTSAVQVAFATLVRAQRFGDVTRY